MPSFNYMPKQFQNRAFSKPRFHNLKLFRHTVKALLCSLAALTVSGCQKYCDEFAPDIGYFPTPCLIESRPSAFEPLKNDERLRDWGKELRIGYAFTEEQDYYRAITAFKRAHVLLPSKERERREQILYNIFQCYYLAYKYQEAIEAFEGTALENVPKQFPAFHDLLIALYDCYQKVGNCTKARKILSLIEQEYPNDAASLELSTAFIKADLENIPEAASATNYQEEVNDLMWEYSWVSKSPKKARLYQALLPGAGYYYVGLKNTALTSLVLNGLFIWASYSFFNKGYTAAGLITLSLETGWYIGGINGAGIAAREFNERLYELNAKEFMRSRSLFPILMIQTSF